MSHTEAALIYTLWQVVSLPFKQTKYFILLGNLNVQYISSKCDVFIYVVFKLLHWCYTDVLWSRGQNKQGAINKHCLLVKACCFFPHHPDRASRFLLNVPLLKYTSFEVISIFCVNYLHGCSFSKMFWRRQTVFSSSWWELWELKCVILNFDIVMQKLRVCECVCIFVQ